MNRYRDTSDLCTSTIRQWENEMPCTWPHYSENNSYPFWMESLFVVLAFSSCKIWHSSGGLVKFGDFVAYSLANYYIHGFEPPLRFYSRSRGRRFTKGTFSLSRLGCLVCFFILFFKKNFALLIKLVNFIKHHGYHKTVILAQGIWRLRKWLGETLLVRLIILLSKSLLRFTRQL